MPKILKQLKYKNETKPYYLNEEHMPKFWYNIILICPISPLPPLHPGVENLFISDALSFSYVSHRTRSGTIYREIPREVRDKYLVVSTNRLWIRATSPGNNWKRLVRLAYKWKGVSKGSKTNTAVAPGILQCSSRHQENYDWDGRRTMVALPLHVVPE